MTGVAVPLLLIFTPGTALLGLLLLDIENRRKLETALVESERRFKDVAETYSDRLWEMDKKFRFTFIDEISGSGLPATPKSFLGRTRWDIHGGDTENDKHWRRHREDHLAHRSYHNFEYSTTDERGVAQHLSVSGKPFFDAEGAFQGYRGSAKDITERKKAEALAGLLSATIMVANDADNVEQVIRITLDGICDYTGSPLGHAYLADDDGAGILAPSGFWNRQSQDNLSKFKVATAATTFTKGVGLPGRVYASREPSWLVDVSEDETFPRGGASADWNIKSAFAFPVLVGEEVVAVLEFFSFRFMPPDAQLLPVLTQLGIQIGRGIERTRSVEAIRESETKLREILENSPLGIAIVAPGDGDPQVTGQRLFVNTALVQSLGAASRESLLKADIRDSWVDQEQFHAVRAIMAGRKELVDFEALRRRADGSEIWVLMNSRPIRFDDRDCYMVWNLDITERKQAEARLRESEQRFRAIVDSSLSGITLKDRDGRFLFANKTYTSWMKTGVEEILGKTVFDIFSDAAATDINETDIKVLSEAAVYNLEVTRSFADGVTRDLLVNKTRVDLASGGKPAILTVMNDFTEFKRAQRALIAAKEEAEYGNRTKSEFLANMSHELRTPLNAIIGFSQFLQTEMFGPLGHENYQEYVDAINKSGNHLHKVIGDILDISKIEAGEMTIDEEEMRFDTLLDECVQIVRERAERGDIALSVKVAPTLPAFRGDALRLKQIVLNLLSNSIKFTPPGGGISIRAEFGDDEGIVLSVTDTGIGIAPENIPKVLEPFGQVRDDSMRAHAGTGLGLSLSKKLAELHGGILSIESAVDTGTTVTVRFPPERNIERT